MSRCPICNGAGYSETEEHEGARINTKDAQSKLLECGMCYIGNFDETEMAKLPCGQTVCRVGRTNKEKKVASKEDPMNPPCIQGYIITAIKSGKGEIECPGFCGKTRKQTLSDTHIRGFLGTQRDDPVYNEQFQKNLAEAYQIHMEAMDKKNILVNKGVFCPACGSGMVFTLGNGTFNHITSCAQKAKCGITFCTKCKAKKNDTPVPFETKGKHDCQKYTESLQQYQRNPELIEARQKMNNGTLRKHLKDLHMHQCVKCNGSGGWAGGKCFICNGTGKDRMCYVGCEKKGFSPKSCKQFAFEENARLELGKSMEQIQNQINKKRTMRKCPGCGLPASKDDKCNKMRCEGSGGVQGCALYWCWQCGEGIKGLEYYRHFYDHFKSDKTINREYDKSITNRTTRERYKLENGTPIPICSRLPPKCIICKGVKGGKKCYLCGGTGEPDMTWERLESYYTKAEIRRMSSEPRYPEELQDKKSEIRTLVPRDQINWGVWKVE